MLNHLTDKIRHIDADYGEIHYEILYQTRIIYSNNNIEEVQTSKTSSGNVRALIRGGWGFSSFNEIDFDKSIRAASRNARLVSANKLDKKTNLILAGPVKAELKTDYQISPETLSLKEKNELAGNYNNILKHPAIASTRVIYADWKVEKYFANTVGSAISQTRVFTGVSYSAMSKDGSNVQQAFESVGQYGGMEIVLNREERVEEIKKRAIDLLKAEKVESGIYTVLLDPNLAGVFAHEAFGHLSESDFLYENPRMKSVMVLGKRFGPDILNIVDDGSIPGLAGYTPYDDEGIKGGRTFLIRNGLLEARLHSRETACRMNEKTTGNARAVSPAYQPIVRMTNTYIDKGNESFENLLSSIDDGIYAIDYLGGMTNLEMFTFSSAYAYRIKNGKIGKPVRDAVLSGNVFTTLNNISKIGSDLEHHGGLGGCGKGGQGGLPVSTGSPHIVIKDVMIGGV
jgi:TldD protein